MTEPTERALALASEALHAIRADLVRCEGESGSCHATLERAEGGDWIAVTEAVPAVARVIQGVMDERDKLRARDQRIRELAARVGTDESLIPAIPNLLDAIEETP